ncbi:MAG: N-acetylglucosamine-6-phosphate deacetylase [Thermodesulfovibrionia bacterium]|nr:N-acetylglucosamine-6-phosphate deacetylase [Thermodesulfovibrionia bacterium]
MYALTNCDIFTGKQVIHDKSILIKGNTIVDILDEDSLTDEIEIIDLGRKSVAPGFIDLQVNGGGGKLFNDAPTKETILDIAKAHQQFGTTNFLPTLITDSREKIQEAIQSVSSLIKNGDKAILGIHLEGPFINPKKAGVHNKEFIQTLSDTDLSLLSSLDNGKTLITLAPEMCKSELLSQLSSQGILISAGHSDATLEDIQNAVKAGLSCATHLFNAMSQFSSREPGLVGAALVEDDLYCGIIVDGFHVHFSSVKIAWSAKKKGKMFIVTDSMPPVGSHECNFQLGPYSIRVENGKCVTGDDILAGSALDMATAVRNCIQKVGIPKDEALRMASTYPAHYLSLNNKLGYIAPGYEANLTIFNNEINISSVVVNGNLIHFN